MRPTEILRAIIRAPVWNPAPDCHLWVWTTDNYLESALGLIDSLGFEFKRTFCWVKMSDLPVYGPPEAAQRSCGVADTCLQIGLGQYARGAHELCLFATRGDAMVPEPANRPPSVVFAPRREHSRKPDEAFTQWFERVSPGPRLEMFARTPREGWDAWGNETEKFAKAGS
jgi:N6-adenosine-specific RNA methylase IME4